MRGKTKVFEGKAEKKEKGRKRVGKERPRRGVGERKEFVGLGRGEGVGQPGLEKLGEGGGW